jgi:hypothetical protein
MKNIIEAKIKQTEQDYNLLGLYSHEEYVGRIMVLKELLSIIDKEEKGSIEEHRRAQEEDHEYMQLRQLEEEQYNMWKVKDCNISRKFQEAEIQEMFEDLEDEFDQY